MKTVILRELNMFGLAVIYARPMNGKIVHYTVSLATTMTSGRSALDLIQEHIVAEEAGENIQFEVEFIKHKSDGTTNRLTVEEYPMLLKDDPKIKKALDRSKANGMIVPHITYSMKDKLRNIVANLLNPVISRINRVLWKIQKISDEELLYGSDAGISVPYVRHPQGIRSFNRVAYINVAFELTDQHFADAEILNDLRVLHEHDLIVGNLATPCLIELADSVGSGEKSYALICFPVINYDKLEKLIGKDLVQSKTPLQYVGVNNEGQEGEIMHLYGIDFKDKYTIEVVEVTDKSLLSGDQIREMAKQSFNESIPTVNKAAQITRELMKQHPDKFARAELALKKAAIDEEFLSKVFSKPSKKTAKKSKKKVAAKRKKVTKKPLKKKKTTKKVSK